MSKVVDFKTKLYEFNKAQMAQIDPVDPIWFNKHCNEVAKEIWERKPHPRYWMLLCRERTDYTVFVLDKSIKEFGSALIECLNNRGMILDFSKQPDDNYEIWVRDIDTEENFAYYLFDYSNGIVEV